MKDQDGIRNSSAISFLCGKIMYIMDGSRLVDTISQIFVDMASAETLPLWGLWSSYVINFFAPSGGGHWVVQGPFMVEAAKQMGASLSQTSMSVMLGNAWKTILDLTGSRHFRP